MPTEVENVIKKDEGQKVEFKESLKLKKEIGETVSAFSNTNDGIILIGVTHSRGIKGVEIGKKTLEDLANYINMNSDPKIYPEINLHQIEDKVIVEVKIKESEEKPVFYNTHAFKRVGRTNQKMSSDEIRKLAREEKKKIGV
ncbi:hypothetical protein C5S32_09840 [ANME-1 cluster archaeon GoMg1]|nr:hypothetical protein [ANME-1 cluster archaeon GoMg1]